MIVNNPRIKGQTTFAYVAMNDIFSNEELDKIIDYCENNKNLLDGTLSGGDEMPYIRKSKVQFHYPNDETIWMFDKMNDFLNYINTNYYNFDLWGYEFFQYAEYLGTDGGKYDFHTDMLTTDLTESNKAIFNSGTRKLSLTLLLSDPDTDFEGGEFQISASGDELAETINAQKGTVIAFPSFMVHRVKSVTAGIRKSITVWVVGPKFR